VTIEKTAIASDVLSDGIGRRHGKTEVQVEEVLLVGV